MNHLRLAVAAILSAVAVPLQVAAVIVVFGPIADPADRRNVAGSKILIGFAACRLPNAKTIISQPHRAVHYSAAYCKVSLNAILNSVEHELVKLNFHLFIFDLITRHTVSRFSAVLRPFEEP